MSKEWDDIERFLFNAGNPGKAYGPHPDPNGFWVKYFDHLERVEELEGEIRELRLLICDLHDGKANVPSLVYDARDIEPLLEAIEPFTVDGGVSVSSEDIDRLYEAFAPFEPVPSEGRRRG